MSQEINI